MYQQAKYEPLESTPFYPDQMSARGLPPGTVARGHAELDRAFYTGIIGTNYVAEFPMAVTRETLERGRERFNIYCSVCHGRDGQGHGMIVQRGFPQPPSYHTERLRNAPVGHFFDVITHGYGVMYPYASRVAPEDRWAIAAYIRVLQQSEHTPVDEIPAAARKDLEAAR
jgi:mono/diheme cytochrome c family protein